MKEKINFGDFIKQKRLDSGYQSLGEFHRACGIPASTLSRIENNIQHPMPTTLAKLAPHIGVSYEELMIYAGYLPESGSKESKNRDNVTGDMSPIEMKKIPVYSIMDGGGDMFVHENIVGWRLVPAEYMDYIMVRLIDESMFACQFGISDRQILVKKQDTAKDGQTVLAKVKDSLVVRRIKYANDGGIILYPNNPDYEPQFVHVNELNIIGIVIQVISDVK